MKIHHLLAYLQVNDAVKAIEFYTSVFGATEKFRLTDPNGRIGHAVLDFGGTTLMLAEEFPEYGILGPLTSCGTSVTRHLQVDDADAAIRRAAEAGAEIESEPEDQFYGERSGWLRDPSGPRWNVGHFLDEVTPEEMQRRFTAMMTGTESGLDQLVYKSPIQPSCPPNWTRTSVPRVAKRPPPIKGL